MTNPVELFLVEDQPVYTKGIKNLFARKKDHVYVGGTAKTIDETWEKLKSLCPDIILLDLILENEISTTFCLEVKSKYPGIKVIVLTGSKDSSLLQQVWWNGADAIISKLFDKSEFIETIKSVIDGKRIIGSRLPPFHDKQIKSSNKPFLTKRENQVMVLLMGGYIRKEVAEKLNISNNTVSKHCDNVYGKFGVDSLASFMCEAKKLNIIS